MAPGSTLSSLEEQLAKKLGRRRRRKRLVAAIIVIILCLLLLPWECQTESPREVSADVPAQKTRSMESLTTSRIGRPEFSHNQKRVVAWGAELDQQLHKHRAAVKSCLESYQVQMVNWNFQFEAAKGLIRHGIFNGADDQAVPDDLVRCLEEALPKQVVLPGKYPGGWTHVTLKLIDRIGD